MSQPAKQFRLRADEIQPLAPGHGACIASDRITVHGERVGYMYREDPQDEQDSGWRFLAGDEAAEYLDDPDNSGIYDVNTIANYDPEVIPLLDASIGSAFEREPGGALEEVTMLDFDAPAVAEGEYRPVPEWSIHLPGEFSQRVEDDNHVLWRPGITIWLHVWEDPHGLSPEQRLRAFRANISPDAFEVDEAQSGGLSRLEYRLTETRPEGTVHAVYGYAFGPVESMNVAIYMDDEADLPLALAMLQSVRYNRAELA